MGHRPAGGPASAWRRVGINLLKTRLLLQLPLRQRDEQSVLRRLEESVSAQGMTDTTVLQGAESYQFLWLLRTKSYPYPLEVGGCRALCTITYVQRPGWLIVPTAALEGWF